MATGASFGTASLDVLLPAAPSTWEEAYDLIRDELRNLQIRINSLAKEHGSDIVQLRRDLKERAAELERKIDQMDRQQCKDLVSGHFHELVALVLILGGLALTL